MLSVILEEVMLPSRTACGLPVKKFSIQAAAHGGTDVQVLQFHDEPRWYYGVEGRAEVDKEHSYICVVLIQVRESSIQGQSYSIICRPVRPISKLKWV